MGETSGTDIIIKGGSVELDFDENLYQAENGNPRIRKSSNHKIVRVVINGGGLSYDSGDHPEGLRCTITVVCK